MPSAKTEASELSVAFGILGLDPAGSYSQDEIEQYFDGSLTRDKYEKYRAEYKKKPELYKRLYQVGLTMGEHHSPFRQARVVQWTGPQQQASTTSVAKDLLVANTPISVKTESNVVANLSPSNMLVNLPGGTAPSSREDNWYLTTCPVEFQALYTFVRELRSGLQYLPKDVQSFEETASRADRKKIQKILKESTKQENEEFTDRYLGLCHRVAETSAEMFNETLARSLKTGARRAVLENIARWFFRLNAVRYVLCGIDRKEEFALIVPELTSWFREWDLAEVIAKPDPTRGQSVVDFEVLCRKKDNRHEQRIPYHAEIRWSHGRFSGTPESKLYKDFPWRTLPFFPGL